MTSVMSRHTSTTSLASQNSFQFEAGLLVQCLNRYRSSLEAGCERVLESKCQELAENGSSVMNYGDGACDTVSLNSLPRSSQMKGDNGSTTCRSLDVRAREALGQHLIELLATVVLPDPPQSINEVDTKLADGLPSIPDKLMPTDADCERYRALAEKNRKKGLHLPTDKIYTAFKEFNRRFSYPVCIYIVAIAEHIIGNFLQAAICYEEKALTEKTIRASTVETLFILYRDRIRARRRIVEHRLTSRFPQDYDRCVDELGSFLHTCLEHMNVILRIFREPVLMASSEENAFVIFGSIIDLYNNMRILLDSVEEQDEESCAPILTTTTEISADSQSTNRDCLDGPRRSPSLSAPSPASLEPSSPLEADHNDNPSLEQLSHEQPNAVSLSEIRPVLRQRLVGVSLIELAEDDSFHAFSQYASVVLDSLGRDRAWALCMKENMIQTLCHLSRTILHTASICKLQTAFGGMLSPAFSDTRWTYLHSMVCPRCRFWDSVAVSSPRRRSISSNAVRLSSGHSPRDEVHLTTRKTSDTANRHHRSSQSASSADIPTGSAACNYLVNAFKYLLPRFLLMPIFHFFYLHELIETLHRCAYDEEDRARLSEVLSMLSKTRSTLERDVSRNPWLCLHLARLMSTGFMAGRYHPLYLDVLAGYACPPPSPNTHQTPPSPTMFNQNVNPAPPVSNLTPLGGANSFHANSVSLPSSSSSAFNPVGETPAFGQQNKADEIERLLGGKEKLTADYGRASLGDFIMEGRVHLRTEAKRSSYEHIAYLFTGLLIICKWQERRTPLTSVGSGQPTVLRVKHRIPLDAIHVIDVPPVVQPNLVSYVGNSGTVTSTAVGAALLAASGATNSAFQSFTSTGNGTDDTSSSNLLTSGLSGSVLSQSSLASAGGPGVSAYPYVFELEFVECHQLNSFPSCVTSPSQSHRSSHHHHVHPHIRHTSPQKLGGATSSETPCPDGSSTGAGTGVGLSNSPNCLGDSQQVHRVWLAMRTPEEKADWMASLLSIQVHRFAQPDTLDTIIFETNTAGSVHGLPSSLNSSEDGLEAEDCSPTESEEYLDDQTEEALEPFVQGSSVLGYQADAHSPGFSSKELTVNPADSGPTGLSRSAPGDGIFVNDSNRLDTTLCLTKPIPTNAALRPTTPAEIRLGQSGPTVAAGFPPQIRMATLEKLVERLTYPTYFDTRLVNTFLLVFRRVTTADTFLDLLIERFRVPDPEFLPEELVVDTEHGQLESPSQHMLKRFRSGYKKRVQTRVIMVLSRWVRSTRYYQNDFTPRPDLRRRLTEFLATVQSRHLASAVRRIEQYIESRPADADAKSVITVVGPNSPHSDVQSENTDSTGTTIRRTESLSTAVSLPLTENSGHLQPLSLFSIHPYRLAEQVTLYEWELYRRIQFWEVDGRDHSHNGTPNLDRSKLFSNRFRNWLVYAILSEQHPDDRAAVIQRVIDLMLMMERMNNLQGSQEAKSALISASVFRLRKAFQSIRKNRHYRDVVDRIRKEGTSGPKPVSPYHENSNSVSSACPNGSMGSGNANLVAGFGLPFATKSSKAHERRIKALEKQQASGDICHPCVPFIAAGVMTRLIHLDVRQPDIVTTEAGTTLINCWKHRQLAEVVERYLAFQRIPYTFCVNLDIRNALEHLDPLALAEVSSELDFEQRMYELSESYEPRESETNTDASCAPSVEVERRISKEVIQAANLLSNCSLKERMSTHSMSSFDALISPPTGAPNSSRVYTPFDTTGRSSRGKVKGPQSISPPAGLCQPNTRGPDTERVRQLQNSQKYLRIPNTPSFGSGDAAYSSLSGVHQHSMSDSQVLSPSHRSNPYPPSLSLPQANQASCRACLSPPVTPPFSSEQLTSSALLHSSPVPPPLPPRKSGQTGNSSGGGSSSKPSHSPSPMPPSPTVSTHWHSTVDNPLYFPPPPPPIPPRASYSSGPPRSSTVHRIPNSAGPSAGNTFTFCAETPTPNRIIANDMPPPLPPRRGNTPSCGSASERTDVQRSPDFVLSESSSNASAVRMSLVSPTQ
ncbi:unnamed protein product [Calicophoron daubneyi]|uniref:Uncharacterized protein n=1 Tax=Calicophoron daubneyi TaxID=300641 RepID=A0AAV2TNW8_CALDB